MNNNSTVFKFHGNNMIVHAKGPNIDRNISSSFHSNLQSSTMNLQRNFERLGNAELCSQRSMLYGREPSPTASVRSDFQPRNFYQPFNPGCSQSTYNGRAGSPVSMRVHAKGSNIDRNISSSFHSNLQSSTMNLQRNFERQGNAELCSQRNMFYGREPSPTASVRSDFQPRNFYQPFKPGYSQSTYSSRAGSPVSMRSIGSTASVAMVLASGIENGNFDDHEWSILLQAIEKNRRRRAEQRRKLKLASGEQGSNSSMSSDDCMSTRTGYRRRLDRNYKENVPQSLPSLDNRSIETNFRKDIRDTRQQAGYAMENSSRRYLENISSLHNKPNNIFHSQMNPKNSHFTKSLQNSTINKNQKDRFKSGFQFPSQRYNINNSVMPIEELRKNENVKSLNKNCNNKKRKQTSDVDANSSEDDNIFLDATRPNAVSKTLTKQRNNNSRQKRNVDCLDDVPVSAKKKRKTTPINNNKAGQKTKNISGNNEFVFAKPQFPIRKKPIEKLISKSAEPYSNIAFNVQEEITRVQAVDAPSQEIEAAYKPAEATQVTNSDVSLRPSFIKRKLFTQTLDITERKNNSSESLSTDSPQSNIYSALLREKHKTRKLATSQSLLSRDVNQDDNNLLDLIHKIVPPSQVNTTNTTKQSHTRANKNKTASDGDDKWDITSILSTCNNDSVSDTYTDDEIFKVSNGVKTNKTSKCKDKGNHKQVNANSDKKKTTDKPKINEDAMAKCYVTVHKLKITPASRQTKSPFKESPAKKVALSNRRIAAFWNTDTESDCESPSTPRGLKEKYSHDTPKNNNIATQKQSSIKSFLEVRPNISTNKISKNTKTKIKKAPTAKLVMTRRQTKNQSAVEESCSPKNDFPIRTNVSQAKSKQSNIKKPKEKITKTQPVPENKKTRNRSLNSIQSHTDNTKKPKLQKNANHQLQAKTKDNVEDIQNGTICKVLRSRMIDLSSSFNSDKFELTGLSLARKSRTPSKRISFNKSRNATVKKGRNKK